VPAILLTCGWWVITHQIFKFKAICQDLLNIPPWYMHPFIPVILNSNIYQALSLMWHELLLRGIIWETDCTTSCIPYTKTHPTISSLLNQIINDRKRITRVSYLIPYLPQLYYSIYFQNSIRMDQFWIFLCSLNYW